MQGAFILACICIIIILILLISSLLSSRTNFENHDTYKLDYDKYRNYFTTNIVTAGSITPAIIDLSGYNISTCCDTQVTLFNTQMYTTLVPGLAIPIIGFSDSPGSPFSQLIVPGVEFNFARQYIKLLSANTLASLKPEDGYPIVTMKPLTILYQGMQKIINSVETGDTEGKLGVNFIRDKSIIIDFRRHRVYITSH